MLRKTQIHFFFLTALTAQTAQTAQTEEFMFQNVAYRPTVYRTGTLGEQIVLICFGPIGSEIIWWIRYILNLQAKREINELKSTGAFKETKLKDLQEKNSEIEKFYETEGAQWKTKFEETSKLKKEQTSRIVEMKDLVQVSKLKKKLRENAIGILLPTLFWLTVIENCSSQSLIYRKVGSSIWRDTI